MKKVLSLLLAVMMVISLCPITALADEVNPIELQQVEAQEEQQEEPIPEPSEEQPTEEQPEKPQQSGMNTLDLTGEAAPLAEGSANGGYYTESGAVIAFDENGISGCNYTVDETDHELYIKDVGIYRNVSISKTYIIRMHAADFSLKNNGSTKVTLQTANGYDQPIGSLESGEQKSAADLSAIKQINLKKLTNARYSFTNVTDVYFTYIESVGDGKLNAAILIEIIPDSIKVNGSEFTAEKTELTGWNRIKSDGSTEKVECNNIYMTTLAYGDERLSLDFNGAVKYAGQALGSEKAEFSNISFTELFANSDYAVTGDKKATGVSCAALFGETLPAGLSENDKVVFVAGYDAEGNAKAGIIIRIKNVQKISTVEEFVAFRDSVNAGATNIDVKLMADIDLSSVCGEGIGSWTPIEGFAGTFDGNGHTISNLYVANDTDDAALFGTTAAGSIIKNLGVVSAKIIRTAKVGNPKSAIFAVTIGGEVDSCYTKDCAITVYGTWSALFCNYNNGSISNCYVIGGAITDLASGKDIRSFANSNNRKTGTVSNCYAAKVTLKTDATIAADTFLNANKGLSNCYVLDSDNNTIKKVTVKDEAWFKSDEAIAALGEAWEKDTDNKNDGFPVLKSQKNSGSDKPTGKNNGIFTVQLEDGTEIYPEELAKPESITWGGDTYPKDITYYEDGIWKITVPAGTSKLKFSVDNLKNLAGVENKTDYAYFATWKGSLQGQISQGEPTVLQIDPDYLGADEEFAYSISTLEDYKDYCYETEYKDGFYTIPLEQLMRSPADMKDVEKQVWGELDSQYKYAVVLIGTWDNGRPVNGYDAMVLVQIGGDGESGENTPPVRRSNVAASNLVNVDDEKLQYTVDLSDVFYDADGDALTYKVRLGTDGEYVPFEGSTYTHTLTDWNGETLYFTANDGKTDGGSYIVKLNISRDVLIAICEAIVADPSDYWTENDNWDGETYLSARYQRFVKSLKDYKTAGSSESFYKKNLIEAYKKLMPKSKVNASSIYVAVEIWAKQIDTSKYTEESVPPYEKALEAARALYDNGAVANKPNEGENQAEIDRVAAACREAKENLVWKSEYKKAFEFYQKNRSNAEKLLEVYDPAKYTESDYTAESWQAFVSAWNDLKADVDFEFDEVSGTVREYKMLKNFEAHMKALPEKFNALVSAVDVTVSFKYIENMHFRYEAATVGTDGYYNAAMTLKAGETTVMDAANLSGRTLYTFASTRAQVKEGMSKNNNCMGSKPLYALFINGVYVASGDLSGIGSEYIGGYQLHNGDKVVLARITAQFRGSEASSGYDSTTWFYEPNLKPEGIENSVGLIAINSVTQNAKVGDSVTVKASARTAYNSNLGKKLNAEGLTLMVSEPSEKNEISQNWQKTVFKTNANGTVEYVFAEPGYYTVAVVNEKYDEPTLTNVYGITTAGTYNTLMIGDFTTVYIAPADDDEALIAEWREKNLAEAKAYFEQFKYYDFDSGVYEDTIVPMYKALVANQKNAKTFKELINSYNSDFAEIQSTVNKNLRNHKAMVEELRGYLRNIPADLSEINYSYSYIVGKIQRIYGGMNDYEKNLLSDKERALAEKLMLLDANNLPTGKKVAIDVQKNDNVVIAKSYGWLESAPNENCVYKVVVGGKVQRIYYEWSNTTVSSDGSGNFEPTDKDMAAYPGDHVHARRLVATSDDAYWMVFSYDGGNTWNLSTKVDGGEGMFSADFTMPETDADTLVFALKMVSKAEYEKMKLNAETPEMALEEAQAAYKAALEEAFAAYDKDRYTAENYTTLRYAKEDGITNINKAKTVTAVVNYFNIALDAMKAVPQKAQVYVEVKNETFTESYVDDDGNTITPPWTGTLVAEWVDIDEDSTMMSCVVKALGNHGYVAVGAENNYISSINGLGEFGGGSGSGWMGTLNDWFTNFGFGEFSVANGGLKAGDRISVMYTCAYGGDIGGAVEGNTDTTLKELSATNGTLSPAFGKETMSYLLTMEEGKHTVTLNYTASNKAFQVRTYLNQYTPSSNDYYACGETISVKEGDIIYVACGDPIWPSMAGNDSLTLVPHVYEITVVGSTGAVEKLIKALPAPEKLEYSDKGDVENAERLFDALGEDEQAKLDEQLKAKLRKCIERMAELERVNAVEELIAALPAKLPISDEEKVKVDEAKDAFDALGEELQKDVKSVYTNKLLSLLGQQKIYFDYQGGKENTKLLFTQKDGKLAVLPGTTKENYHFDGWYTEKDGGTQISLETIFTESCKLYAHWLDNVQYVEKLISAIGEVELTDECKERIDAARAAVDALSEEDKVNVNNYEVLTAAEAEYARLVKEAEDKAAAKAVDDLIAAIGEVKLTEECDAKIKAARKAFNALTPAQKAFVKNEKVLTDAEAEYQRLLDQHKADEAAAKAVEDLINAIGKVEFTDECKAKIDAARAAYDKLTDAQKKLVKNLKVLTDAEAEYARLVKEAEDKAAAKAVDEAVAKLAPVTLESGNAVKAARKAFDALTPEQKKLLDPETEGKLVAAENEYKKLVKEDADKKAAKEVEDKIAALQPVTKDSGEAIKDARSSYEALTPEQKALVSKDSVAALDKAEKVYDMIIASTKPGTAVGDNTGSTSGSGVIKITANAAAKGEQNPHTGAPVMSMAPAVLVLAAAALVLKKRG